MKIELSATNKKMQNLAKANGFKFDWSSRIWEGPSVSENHPLRKFEVVEKNDNANNGAAEINSKVTYHEAYEKHGFDFAEEGNY